MDFRSSLAGLVLSMAYRMGVWGAGPPPHIMILHVLGGGEKGDHPLCTLLSIQLDSDMFSNAFNIIPIVCWLGFMICYVFSMVVGGFDGFVEKL